MLVCAVYTLVSWCQQSCATQHLLKYPPSKSAVGNSAFWPSNVGSWCTHSVILESPGQRNNRVRSPCTWWSNKRVSQKTSLEGEMLDWTLWMHHLEFCFNLASIMIFMTPAWLAMMIFNILVEVIDGSLTSSVPMGTVLNTMMTRWFEGWMYWFLCSTIVSLSWFSLFGDLALHYRIHRKVTFGSSCSLAPGGDWALCITEHL